MSNDSASTNEDLTPTKNEEMKSTRDAITIDASRPSPEQDDECIYRHAQDLQRLIAPWLQEDPTITSAGLQSFLTPEVQKKIESVKLRLVERLEELGKRRQECLKTLIANGWFLGPNTPMEQLQHFTDSLGANPGCEKDTISSYFRERLDSIECELSKAYPSRSQILRDAFDVHEAGKYTLSVPVFLSQADGIWRDQFSKNFFQIRKRKSTLQDCNNYPQLEYVATMLTLLEPKKEGENNSLWATESERDSSFNALNRHQVLHGECVNYATEQNSLKAISLLICFRWICRMVAQ